MPDRLRRFLVPALLLVFAPAPALAHHSVAGFFDPNEKVEIEGNWMTMTDSDGTAAKFRLIAKR